MNKPKTVKIKQPEIVEVGSVWVNERNKRAPILGIKIGNVNYVGFKNNRKAENPNIANAPDYFVYKHSTTESLAPVGMVWKLFVEVPDEKLKDKMIIEVNLCIKIGDNDYYAPIRRNRKTARDAPFVLLAPGIIEKTVEDITSDEKPMYGPDSVSDAGASTVDAEEPATKSKRTKSKPTRTRTKKSASA